MPTSRKRREKWGTPGLLVSAIRGRRLRLQAGGVEHVGSYFAFVALGGDFLAVQQEGDTGGVSGFYYDLVAGADGGVGGRDQGFLGCGFAVDDEGDPSRLLGADQQGESAGRLCRSGLTRGLGRRQVGIRFSGRLTR